MSLADRLVDDARRWQQYWNRLSDLDRCLTLDIERSR